MLSWRGEVAVRQNDPLVGVVSVQIVGEDGRVLVEQRSLLKLALR